MSLKTTLRHQVEGVILAEDRNNIPFHTVSINKLDLWVEPCAVYKLIMLHPDELALVKDRKECDHTEEYLDIRLQNKYLPRSIHEAQDAPPEGQPRLYWINSSGYARCPLTCIEPAAYKESPMPKFHVQLLYDVYAYMQYFRLYHRDVPYLYEPICIELVYCDYKQSVENMMAGLSLTSNGPPLDACPHPIEISLYRRPLKERRVFKKKPVDDDPFAGDI